MKCKVTKVMAKTIQKHIPEYTIEYVELKPEAYERYVSYDLLEHENDFDWNKKVFKVIRVVYPSEYYSCSAYLTTNDLVRCLHGSRNKTINEFIDQVWRAIEI